MIEDIISLGLIIGCIVLAGLFSGCEMGFISINRVRLNHLVSSKHPKAIIISQLLEDIPHLMATMLIGINLVIIIASCLTTYIFKEIVLYAEASLTIILLLLGEIVPKTIFRHHSNKLMLTLACQIKTAYHILLPVVKLITKTTNPFIKLLNKGQVVKRPFLTKDELIILMEEEANLDKDEEEMLDGVFDLSLTRVKEVMRPRVDIISLSSEATMGEVLECFSQHQYSRVPVYDETIDNIIGIIYVKDIIGLLDSPNIDRLTAIEFIRFPYFVPTTKRIDRLLEEFQSQKTQMAIVVDEYGGTAGLVTLEDILEEIVGEIQDEHETTPRQIIPLGNGAYLIDAKTDIDKLNEELNWSLPSTDFETISGLILEVLGRIPQPEEIVEYANLRITILESDERSIEKIKVVEVMTND